MAQSAVEEKQDQQTAQDVEFAEAQGTENAGSGGGIDLLLDMKVPITVAIGKVEMPVKRLLQLGPGSILKLDKPVEAPADLYLKDTKFATGTIVVVDGRFAVKIKDIIGLDDKIPAQADDEQESAEE